MDRYISINGHIAIMRCRVCNYTWNPRKDPPARCPNPKCRSRRWKAQPKDEPLGEVLMIRLPASADRRLREAAKEKGEAPGVRAAKELIELFG